MAVKVYYTKLCSSVIFGMVGRCGGGYNTVWEDWTPEGRAARNAITREYEAGLNLICGHYTKLETSILREGFRNPLIVTCGPPVMKKLENLPPELRARPQHEWLLLEGVTGGSRLWVAQKYNLPVPCIINDSTGHFAMGQPITDVEQALQLFRDPPRQAFINDRRGFAEQYDNTKRGYHMEKHWREDVIVQQRLPLWISTMNKYGYYVDRLQPFAQEILNQAGVVQPLNLKNKFSNL
jgi:hypothetical protein